MTLADQVTTGVKPGLTPRRYVDTVEYLGMLRRIVRAAGSRVGDADVDDLRALVAIRADLDAAIVEAVRGVRSSGATWQDVGDVLGITRQAAEQFFGPRLREAS